MAKLTTSDLTSLTSNEASAVSTINNNFAAVETAMEKTLSRDGTTPNEMEADFDMNGNDILNAGTINTDTLVVGGNIVVVPGAIGIDDLSDVTLTSETSGDVLRYDGTVWVNYPDSNFATASHVHVIADVTGLQTALDGKAASSHTHAISDITNLQTTLDGKASTSHTHDDRYYTESEVDTLLTGKADTSHTHASTDITDFEEAVEDVVAAALVAGTNISVDYDDTAGTYTIAATGSGSGGDTIIFQTNLTDFKDSVACATTGNITLSGEQTIDGIATSASRVLVRAQNTASENGIYVSDAGAWSRATDADEDAEVTSGLLVLCEDGTTYANTLFTLVTADPIVVGTTGLTFDSIVLPSNPEVLKTVTAATYTFITTDPNKWIKANRATAQTFTVPTNATAKIPVNSVIWIHQYGAGAVTLSPANGSVNIRAPQGLSTNAQYAVMRLKKIATNEWSVIIIGNTVAVANGGTGATNATDARTNLGAAGTSQTDFISGIIASPADQDYRLVEKLPYGITITEVTTKSLSGTCTATTKINTTALGGTANSVSSSAQSQTHSTSNTASAGDAIVMTVSSNSSCVDLSFTIKFTRTLS